MSRNYRYVTKVLSKEKKELKVRTYTCNRWLNFSSNFRFLIFQAEKDFGQGHRIGTGNVWAPLPSILRTRGYVLNFYNLTIPTVVRNINFATVNKWFLFPHGA